MIELPDFKKRWDYENNFYLSCNTQRLAKFSAHYELYKKIITLPGHIVECGVFKGCSLVRWAHFREMFGGSSTKQIIGFDIFDKFPETHHEEDKSKLASWIEQAGSSSISKDQLLEILSKKSLSQKIELIEGDILKTVPKYVKDHPELKIAMLHLDTDVYEPATVILEHLYPKIVKGGILILDDYSVFPGETKAVDEFFKDNKITLHKFPFAMTPTYAVVE